MGGCTIPGLRTHYFNCEVCVYWYWGEGPGAEAPYPNCQTGRKIIEQYRGRDVEA